MQYRNLHLAVNFLRIGAIVPLVLLLLWRVFFEQAQTVVRDWFIQVAFVLWPTSIQILYVPHPHNGVGHAFTIAILVIENAILYSIVALLVHWIVVRVRHSHPRHSH